MNWATLICYTVTTLLTAQAITIRVDRADIRQPDPPSSLINGWRPVPNYDKSRIDRNPAPLHPVLNKFQEHMAASERLRSSQVDYNPLNVLGSFSSLNQPSSKSSFEPRNVSSNRQQYSFLVPPPQNSFKYEFDNSAKKNIGSQNEQFVRASQYATQVVKPADIQTGPSYYIKPASYSTAIHPFAQNQAFGSNYNMQQLMTASRLAAKPFEAQESASEKPFIYSQLLNANNHYYNQISHPSAYKASNFNRDPSFLVHESHEINYATPSYKYRPGSYYVAQAPQTQTYTTAQPEASKQYEQPKIVEKVIEKRPEANYLYVTELHKTRFAPDINEVLPKVNPPMKFGQASTVGQMMHGAKVVYVRPELQHQQYPSSILPLNINQHQPEVEYETPESISLKHYNEQQFMLQQQLIQQDRQRQEKRRQQEIQKQQDELNKRKEEIRKLEQRQKEKQQHLQSLRLEPTQPASFRYPTVADNTKKLTPQFHYQFESPKTSTTPAFSQSTVGSTFQEVDIQKFEVSTTPLTTQYVTQEEFQPRPYHTNKPLRERGPEPTRRRKPSPIRQEEVTETVTYYQETPDGLTETPVQTTIIPETTTQVVTERIRSRRPGIPLRRRKPIASTRDPHTTSTRDSSAKEDETELAKYSTPTIEDFEKKKKVRPNQALKHNSENGVSRRPSTRAPTTQYTSNSYNNNEYYTEITTEIPRTTERAYEEISKNDNYPEAFLKSEFNPADYKPTSERVVTTTETNYEYLTNPAPVEYLTETSVVISSSSPVDYYEATQDSHRQTEETQSLEHLFAKTEATSTETPSPTPTTELVTSAEPSSTTKSRTVSISPKPHRMRPLRFSNTTRPRFSIKDYKSRMDYKNKISTTEPTAAKQVTKSEQTAQIKAYKHGSRTQYTRTTTTTTASTHQASETSTEKPSSRFGTKKRPPGFVGYRRPSTIAPLEKESSSKKSENGYSPPVRKQRPTLRSKLPERKVTEPHNSEIATAESGPVAQSPTTEASSSPESPNEVEGLSIETVSPLNEPLHYTTAPFDIHSEEELFAKASQSVADLTSSASALYSKPGMFKALSTNGENRSITTQLRINTDEPTLPIEAFFQELTKKN